MTRSQALTIVAALSAASIMIAAEPATAQTRPGLNHGP